MSDGTLSVRRRQPKISESSADPLTALRTGDYESFLGRSGSGSRIGHGTVRGQVKSKPVGEIDEFRVERKRAKRLKEYDRLLKGFKHSAALDSVLRKVGQLNFSTTLILYRMFLQRPHFRSFKNLSIVTVSELHWQDETTYF